MADNKETSGVDEQQSVAIVDRKEKVDASSSSSHSRQNSQKSKTPPPVYCEKTIQQSSASNTLQLSSNEDHYQIKLTLSLPKNTQQSNDVSKQQNHSPKTLLPSSVTKKTTAEDDALLGENQKTQREPIVAPKNQIIDKVIHNEKKMLKKTSNTSIESIKSPEEFLESLLSNVSARELSRVVSQEDPFHCAVLKCLLQKFSFKKVSIDHAIRTFLFNFPLPSEGQQIERVLEAFALKYQSDNDTIFNSSDVIHVLTVALVMLNSDLHNPNQKCKMTRSQFASNTKRALVEVSKRDSPYSLPFSDEFYELLYDSVKSEKYIIHEDDSNFSRVGWIIRQVGTTSSQSKKAIEKEKLEDLFPVNDICNLSHVYIPPKGPRPLASGSQPNSMLDLAESMTPEDLSSPTSTHSRQSSFSTSSSLPGQNTAQSPSTGGTSTTSGQQINRRRSTINPVDRKAEFMTILARMSYEGPLYRKKICLAGGEAVGIGKRSWKKFWVVLSGERLYLYTGEDVVAWFEDRLQVPLGNRIDSKNTGTQYIPRYDHCLNTHNMVCIYDSSYKKHVNTFCLYGGDASCSFMQAKDDTQIVEWIDRINFTSAYTTCGIRPLAFPSTSSQSEEVDLTSRNLIIDRKVVEIREKQRKLSIEYDSKLATLQCLLLFSPTVKSQRQKLLNELDKWLGFVKNSKVELEKVKCYNSWLLLELNSCLSTPNSSPVK